MQNYTIEAPLKVYLVSPRVCGHSLGSPDCLVVVPHIIHETSFASIVVTITDGTVGWLLLTAHGELCLKRLN